MDGGAVGYDGAFQVRAPGLERSPARRPGERVAAHRHRGPPPGDGAMRIGRGDGAKGILGAVEGVQPGDRRLETGLHRGRAGGRERNRTEARYVPGASLRGRQQAGEQQKGPDQALVVPQ